MVADDTAAIIEQLGTRTATFAAKYGVEQCVSGYVLHRRTHGAPGRSEFRIHIRARRCGSRLAPVEALAGAI
jgi:hypothetical protein